MNTETATHIFRGSRVALRGSWPTDAGVAALIAVPGTDKELTVPMAQLRKIRS